MKTNNTPKSKQAHIVATEHDRTAAKPALGPDEFASDLDYLTSTRFTFSPFFNPRDIPGYEVFALVEEHAEASGSARISMEEIRKLFHGQFCPDAHVPMMRGVFGIDATIVGDELVVGPRHLQVLLIRHVDRAIKRRSWWWLT